MNRASSHLSTSFAVALTLMAYSAGARGKVTPEEAAALGSTLTELGAEAKANADGSIPAYAGKWQGAPSGLKYDGSYNPDPYADDKPLYSITAQNYQQYAARLGEGQKALFAKYPEYRINVYPTHRDFRYRDAVVQNVKINATGAELTNDGMTLTGAYGGFPFPIPKNGLEIVYNQITGAPAYFIDSPEVSAYVQPNGATGWFETYLKVWNVYQKADNRAAWKDGDVSSYSTTEQKLPPRDAGRVTITSNTFDHSTSPRQAWQYDPGSRRLRKAPDVGFDYPMDQGPRVVDEQNGYNGSPERFEWTLVGKQEMLVPYHTYKVQDRALKYADFIKTRGFPNPELIRYELRRVWVVEGNLKKGYRHIYSKRRMYIEEDSWQKVMGDNYDKRGQLWRVSTDYLLYAYDCQCHYAHAAAYHDLLSGAYSIEKLSNEKPSAVKLNRRDALPNEFTPDAVRRGGQ